MKIRIGILLLCLSMVLTSCVSKKKYSELQTDVDESLKQTSMALSQCEKEKAQLQAEISSLKDRLNKTGTDRLTAEQRAKIFEEELESQKQTNQALLSQLSKLSVISEKEAENMAQSLQNISKQTEYIEELTGTIQAKDSATLSLVMNIKRSLGDINDEDIQVEVKKGVVYISISDKLLFTSGSSDINPKAEAVLGKVAKVVNDHGDLEIIVEGHTDDVPIKNDCMRDNWDLSVKRATSIVRFLQWKHKVAPERMSAAGRSKYIPKTGNDTDKGRSTNRRTEIIITPKLDQFFKLLEAPMEIPTED